MTTCELSSAMSNATDNKKGTQLIDEAIQGAQFACLLKRFEKKVRFQLFKCNQQIDGVCRAETFPDGEGQTTEYGHGQVERFQRRPDRAERPQDCSRSHDGSSSAAKRFIIRMMVRS